MDDTVWWLMLNLRYLIVIANTNCVLQRGNLEFNESVVYWNCSPHWNPMSINYPVVLYWRLGGHLWHISQTFKKRHCRISLRGYKSSTKLNWNYTNLHLVTRMCITLLTIKKISLRVSQAVSGAFCDVTLFVTDTWSMASTVAGIGPPFILKVLPRYS